MMEVALTLRKTFCVTVILNTKGKVAKQVIHLFDTLKPVMLFPVRRSSYISFTIGWEVSLVARNTITHGGA